MKLRLKLIEKIEPLGKRSHHSQTSVSALCSLGKTSVKAAFKCHGRIKVGTKLHYVFPTVGAVNHQPYDGENLHQGNSLLFGIPFRIPP